MKRSEDKKLLTWGFLAASLTSICIFTATVPDLLDMKIRDQTLLPILVVFVSGIIFLVLLAIGMKRPLKEQEKKLSTEGDPSLINFLYLVGFISILISFLMILLFIIASFVFTGIGLASASENGGSLNDMYKVFNFIFILNQVIIFVLNMSFSLIPVLLGEFLIRPRFKKFLWAGFTSNLVTHLIGAGIIIYMLSQVNIYGRIYGRLLIGQYFPLGLAFIGYTVFSIIYYKSAGR